MRPNQGEGDQAHQDPPRRAPPWSLSGEERLWGPMSLLIDVVDVQESRSLFCVFFQHESSSHFQIWKYSCIGHTWKLLPYCPCWALEHPHKWGPRALQNCPVFSSKTQIFFWHFCARLMGSSSSSWSCPGWPRLDPCPLRQGRRRSWSQWRGRSWRPSPGQLTPGSRLEICRDQWDRRSCKIFPNCVKFWGNKANSLGNYRVIYALNE